MANQTQRKTNHDQKPALLIQGTELESNKIADGSLRDLAT